MIKPLANVEQNDKRVADNKMIDGPSHSMGAVLVSVNGHSRRVGRNALIELRKHLRTRRHGFLLINFDINI